MGGGGGFQITKGEGGGPAKRGRLGTRGGRGRFQGGVPTQKKIFWFAESQNFFFCTKEAIIIVYRQVQTGFKL